MTEHYHIVPWFNSEEWHQVYQKIYAPTATLDTEQEGLGILLIWKARCPSLPSGVESTLTLLEVYLQDMKNNDTDNQQLLRLAYSSAIMRFVNHMLDTETAKGSSLYNAAKNLGVPDWIIDLRHDTAHSNNLPSIELLREACIFSLDWLQKHYWDEHQPFLKDYIVGQKETDTDDENKISSLMNICISLSICASSRNKIKNLADIPDADMRESIVNDIRELFMDQVDLSNLKTVSVMGLLNSLNSQSKRLLKTKNISTFVNKTLLGDDSLFLSLELYNNVTNSDFYSKNKLQKDYVQYFEVLLCFLHSNDLILEFILDLIKASENTEYNNYRSKLAALWVSEILKALKRSKEFINKVNKMGQDITAKKRKDVRALFHHWFPNEKHGSLLLDLQKSVPYELTCINFVKPIISAYNTNLIYFIKDLINLLEPHLEKVIAGKICTLAKLISSPEGFPSSSLSKIYTVVDLKAETSPNHRDDIDSDSDVICETDSKYETEPSKSSIWKTASKDHSWATCPIGLLPWYSNQNSNVVMDTEDIK